jgi:hypothetical protein
MMIFPTNSSLLMEEFGSSCNFCDESFLTRKVFESMERNNMQRRIRQFL